MKYYGMPSLFSKECLGVPVAYFTGPWLPMSNVQEFVDYSFSMEYPLQILEEGDRKDNLVKGIVSLLPEFQGDLFNSEENKIECLFEDFIKLGKENKSLYNQWSQKIGDKTRKLVKAKTSVDNFLRNYVHKIIMQAPCHSDCHGGEKGWSVKKSLESHVPLGNVLSFDLENCFERVSHQYIFDFYYNLFENKFESKDIRRDLAGFLTHISSVSRKYEGEEMRYFEGARLNINPKPKKVILEESMLPQGSPIGIHLFNRLFYPIDKIFHEKARQKGLKYSRWVDDMIISSPKSSSKMLDKFLGALYVTRHDFPIAVNKVFWQQGLENFYLLGHKISENKVIKVDKKEMKKGKLIAPYFYQLEKESIFDSWTDEEIPVEEFEF